MMLFFLRLGEVSHYKGWNSDKIEGFGRDFLESSLEKLERLIRQIRVDIESEE